MVVGLVTPAKTAFRNPPGSALLGEALRVVAASAVGAANSATTTAAASATDLADSLIPVVSLDPTRPSLLAWAHAIVRPQFPRS